MMTADKWSIFSDHELKILLWDAEDIQDSKWIKAIRKEMSKRTREA